MPNVTLSIAAETKKRMEEHPEVKWSSAIRVLIEKKIADFEITENLAQKSLLTEKDVELLSNKVNKEMGLHAKRLLDAACR